MANKENTDPTAASMANVSKRRKLMKEETIGSILEAGQSLKSCIKGACGTLLPSLPVSLCLSAISSIINLLDTLKDRPYTNWTIGELRYLVTEVAPALSVKANGDDAAMSTYAAVSKEAENLIGNVPEAWELLDPTYMLIDTAGAVSAAVTAVVTNWPPKDADNNTRHHTTVTLVPGSTRLLRLAHPLADQLEMDRHALAAMLIQKGANRLFVMDLPLPIMDYP